MEDRLGCLVRSLFDDSLAYGVLAPRKKQQPDDFIDQFAKREDVLRETKNYLKKISAYFTTAQEQQPAENTVGELTVPIPEPSTLPEEPNHANEPEQPQQRPGLVPPANTPPPLQSAATFEQTRTAFSIAVNGKVNVVFRGGIEGKNTSGKAVIIRDVIIPPELGLSFDPATAQIHGIPLQACECKLKVLFQFGTHDPGDPLLTGECNLIINPDPKTLWKNLPSDSDDIYWKEDQATATIVGKDGLNMIVASKRGRSHAHVGSFRDDDFCLMQDEASGWRVMTVADGAGSASKSRRGSQLAAKIATENVLQALNGERGRKLVNSLVEFENNRTAITNELYYLFGTAAKEAVHAIDGEAKSTGAAYKDFSTTLIVTIHTKVAAGYFVAVYWVGDGGVGVYRHGHEVKILGRADSGEFAGQTRFLDSAMLDSQEIMNRIKVTIVPDFSAIIVMTDGITDPWFETDANIENIDKWHELWKELTPAIVSDTPEIALLDWLDFWSPGNHDDRTIAMLCPTGPLPQAMPEEAA